MNAPTLFDLEPHISESGYLPRVEREIATLRLFGDQRGRIPDEAAHELGKDFMFIRPACAILHKQGLLRETGLKRKARGCKVRGNPVEAEAPGTVRRVEAARI